MELLTDKFQFVIVNNEAEIAEAKKLGHANVKVVCPECGKQILRTTGTAEFILKYKCAQHDKNAQS